MPVVVCLGLGHYILESGESREHYIRLPGRQPQTVAIFSSGPVGMKQRTARIVSSPGGSPAIVMIDGSAQIRATDITGNLEAHTRGARVVIENIGDDV